MELHRSVVIFLDMHTAEMGAHVFYVIPTLRCLQRHCKWLDSRWFELWIARLDVINMPILVITCRASLIFNGLT